MLIRGLVSSAAAAALIPRLRLFSVVPGVLRPLGVDGLEPDEVVVVLDVAPGVGGSGVVGMCVGGRGKADRIAEAI
jgi:hypothetical protein